MKVNKNLVKITGDFLLGVILDEIIKISQKFRKEFIGNNWHCPEFFEINLEKISQDNFLNLSKSSMRRYIKKLIKLKYISVDTTEKKHKYKVNFNTINKDLQNIGSETIEPILKEKVEKVNEVFNYETEEFEGYKQVSIDEICKTKAPENNQEQVKTKFDLNLNQAKIENFIKSNINYSKMKLKCQDKEKFALYNSIYKVIIDTIMTKNGIVKINGQEKDISAVKSIFMKLTEIDINQAIAKIKNITYSIKNIKGYIVSLLYNNYIERNIGIKIFSNHFGIEVEESLWAVN